MISPLSGANKHPPVSEAFKPIPIPPCDPLKSKIAGAPSGNGGLPEVVVTAQTKPMPVPPCDPLKSKIAVAKADVHLHDASVAMGGIIQEGQPGSAGISSLPIFYITPNPDVRERRIDPASIYASGGINTLPAEAIMIGDVNEGMPSPGSRVAVGDVNEGKPNPAKQVDHPAVRAMKALASRFTGMFLR